MQIHPLALGVGRGVVDTGAKGGDCGKGDSWRSLFPGNFGAAFLGPSLVPCSHCHGNHQLSRCWRLCLQPVDGLQGLYTLSGCCSGGHLRSSQFALSTASGSALPKHPVLKKQQDETRSQGSQAGLGGDTVASVFLPQGHAESNPPEAGPIPV